MDARRPLVLILVALALALMVACSDSGDGDDSATPDGIADSRATLEYIRQTAEAAGTKAAEGGAPRATETPLPLTALSGEFEVRFRFEERPVDSDLRDLLEMPEDLDVAIGEGTVTISGRSPFISVSGSLTPEGAISATGSGSVESYDDISATFEGTLQDEELSGTYTLTGTGIPGGSVIFLITGEPD